MVLNVGRLVLSILTSSGKASLRSLPAVSKTGEDQQQQPEKDQEGRDSSRPVAGSGPVVSEDQQRTHALLPRQSAVRAEERFGP